MSSLDTKCQWAEWELRCDELLETGLIDQAVVNIDQNGWARNKKSWPVNRKISIRFNAGRRHKFSRLNFSSIFYNFVLTQVSLGLLDWGISLTYTQEFITYIHLTHDYMQTMDVWWQGVIFNKDAILKKTWQIRLSTRFVLCQLRLHSVYYSNLLLTLVGPFKSTVLWEASLARSSHQQAN